MVPRVLLHGAAVCLLAPCIAESQNDPIVPKTLQAGLLARFEESSSRVLRLAEAIPDDRFAWRPAPGVRSISEVLVHIGLRQLLHDDGCGSQAIDSDR